MGELAAARALVDYKGCMHCLKSTWKQVLACSACTFVCSLHFFSALINFYIIQQLITFSSSFRFAFHHSLGNVYKCAPSSQPTSFHFSFLFLKLLILSFPLLVSSEHFNSSVRYLFPQPTLIHPSISVLRDLSARLTFPFFSI